MQPEKRPRKPCYHFGFMKNLFYFVSLFLLLLGCEKAPDDNSTIVIGTSADNDPYEFISDKQVVGFDIDMINEIGKKFGKTIQVKNMSFHGLIPALLTNDVDLIIAGVSATEERSKSVDFSIPYTESCMSIMSAANFKISSIQDLKNKTIGAQIGSTWHQKAQKIAEEIEGVKVKALSNNLLLVEELKINNIDAVILETTQVEKFISTNGNLNRFDLEDSKVPLAIAFPKDSKIKEDINQTILELQQNGYVEFLKKKWFN
jgi:polar amino acid transport system substrate-binding protein